MRAAAEARSSVDRSSSPPFGDERSDDRRGNLARSAGCRFVFDGDGGVDGGTCGDLVDVELDVGVDVGDRGCSPGNEVRRGSRRRRKESKEREGHETKDLDLVGKVAASGSPSALMLAAIMLARSCRGGYLK